MSDIVTDHHDKSSYLRKRFTIATTMDGSTLNINTSETEESTPAKEIEHGIEREFGEFQQEELESLRGANTKLSELGLSTPERGEDDALLRQQHYDSLDFNGRVSALTNNFWMWWKDGWYRELTEKLSKDNPRLPDRRALIANLDDIITESGYEDMGTLVLNNKRDSMGQDMWDKRMLIIADVYLKMRKKGYAGIMLRT